MMNTAKRFTALVLALGFLAGLCGAAAETAGPEEYAGVWYMSTTMTGDVELDLSSNENKIILILEEAGTGRLTTAEPEEGMPVSWSADDSGMVTCTIMNSNNAANHVLDMEIRDGFLIMTVEDLIYVFTRNAGEKISVRRTTEAEFSFTAGDAGISSEELAESIMAVMRKRLEAWGIDGAKLEQTGPDRIRAEIPGGKSEELISMLCRTGVLRFLDPDGQVIMTEAQIESAEYTWALDMFQHTVVFRLTDEGTEIFAEATTVNLGRNIRVLLDDEVLVDATVDEPITDGIGRITGNFTGAEAKSIVAMLQGGSLPAAITLEDLTAETEYMRGEDTAAE